MTFDSIKLLEIGAAIAALLVAIIGHEIMHGAHFVSYLSLKFKIYKIAHFLAKAEPYGMIVIIIILVTPLKIPLLVWPTQTILELLLTQG